MKTDARVRYTRMRIREAFLQCLKEKPVSRITVKELCDLAEINRATFYTHYSDPFDLLEKLEAETLDKLRTMISERAFKGEDGLLLTLLRGMQGDKNDTGLLGSRNGDPNFGSKISALFYESYLPGMAKQLPELDERQRNAVYRFLAGGCGNLLTDWVNGGMQTPPEELAQEMNELCAAVMTVYANDGGGNA